MPTDWIPRQAEALVRRMASQFPSVLVTGPRQSGKTSLLRRLFPQASYLSLDLPALAEAARTAPEQLLDGYSEPLIIDEVQYAPSLLRHLKARIDRRRSPGRFLLTGSQVFPLMQGVSESLAGRCGVLELGTLSQAELVAAQHKLDEASAMFLGGYPELHVGADTDLWFSSYVATYLERDVRNVLRVADLATFNRFLRSCALRTAQMLNVADLARDVGVSPNTARSWLSLLQASGIVTLVEPYFGNRLKRMIKAPKLVFRDTGLAAFLAGFHSPAELVASHLAGPFWESHVHGQLLRHFTNHAERWPIYFWRTAHGVEVDLVVERAGGALCAVECKWGEQPGVSDAGGLDALLQSESDDVKDRIIVCRTPASYALPNGVWVTDVGSAIHRIAGR